jgi:hypothetical protein
MRWPPIVLIACLAATAAHALEGTWTATGEPARPDRINLGLTYGHTHNHGSTYATSALAGLTVAQIHASASAPVRFALDREAGRVEFEGAFAGGRGDGRFTFLPDATYLDKVRALGVADSRRSRQGPSQDERLLAFALLDVSTDYIRGIAAAGYKVALDDYLSMRIFDVTTDYIHAMRALGFRDLSADELVSTRIHGVTPEYVRAMRDGGWKLSLDQLMSFRIHDVTPEWIDALRKLGYERLDADELISARIFDVTPEFIRGLKDAGCDLPMNRVIEMRIHGLDLDDLSKRRAI